MCTTKQSGVEDLLLLLLMHLVLLLLEPARVALITKLTLPVHMRMSLRVRGHPNSLSLRLVLRNMLLLLLLPPMLTMLSVPTRPTRNRMRGTPRCTYAYADIDSRVRVRRVEVVVKVRPGSSYARG